MAAPRQRDLFIRRTGSQQHRTHAQLAPPGQRVARALRRHGGLALAGLGACVAAAWLGAGLIQPIYGARASLIVEPTPRYAAGGSPDTFAATDPTVALQTLAQELGSRELIADAARSLGPKLENHWLRPRYRGRWTPAERLDTAAQRQIRITPVTGSRMVQIETTAPSPALATAFLAAVLDQQRALVEAGERARAAAGVASLRQQAEAAAVRLAQAQAALTAQATALGLADPAEQLAAAEQRWQQLAAATTTADLAAWQQGSQIQAGLHPAPPAALEAQRGALSARIAQLQTQYLPQAAPLVQARQALAGLDSDLRAARERDQETAEAALATVRQQQADLEAALARAAARQQDLHAASARLDQAQRQLAASQTVYSTLLQQLSESLAHASHVQLPWQLLSQPRPWPAPLQPRRGALVGAAVALGTLLGLGLVALAEWRDDRLHYPEAAEQGLPIVAALPEARAGAASLERCAAALLRAQSETGASVVLVTSLEPGTGKSGVVRDVAASLQQAGTVLVLEGNLGRPAVHRGAHARSDVPASPGMVELLAGEVGVEEALRAGEAGMSNRICAGRPATASLLLPLAGGAVSDLLAAARQRHDWVLVDGAAMSDGPEAELWAALSDCVLVVARIGVTSRSRLRRACDALEAAGASEVALVLTEVPARAVRQIRLNWLGGEPSVAASEISAWRQRAG